MKTVLLFAFCVVAVSSQDDALKQIVQNCARKEGIDETHKDEIKKLVAGDLQEPSKNSKCFIACLMESAGTFSGNNFNVDVFKKIVSDKMGNSENVNKLGEVFNECANAVESQDRCDRVWEYTKCAVPKFKELGVN